MKKFIFYFLLSVIQFHNILAQCTPPASDDCLDAHVLCSLDEVNGYSCTTVDYSNPSGCNPLCPSGGLSTNMSWWAFTCEGGTVCITITFSNCKLNSGLQMGIWGDCICGSSIACNPICNGPGSYSICGLLEPCTTYYLFVNGCNGDVCDFTLNTTGGQAQKLKPISKINNVASQILNLCPSECAKSFFVNQQPGGCIPTYQWTLDGQIISGQTTNQLELVFESEGDYSLGVSAIIGNPN